MLSEYTCYSHIRVVLEMCFFSAFITHSFWNSSFFILFCNIYTSSSPCWLRVNSCPSSSSGRLRVNSYPSSSSDRLRVNSYPF